MYYLDLVCKCKSVEKRSQTVHKENMKRSATSTPSKTKKSKVAVAKRSYKRFYPVPRPLGQYSSGFPKQLAMTHRYSQNVQYTHVGPNANSQYANFGTNCLFDPWLTVGGHQPLYFDQVAAIYQHYIP